MPNAKEEGDLLGASELRIIKQRLRRRPKRPILISAEDHKYGG